MKLAFVGGNGHRLLSGLLDDAAAHGITQVAVAGDGLDDDRARTVYDGVSQRVACAWFDDAQVMYDTFRPDVVNVGVRYGHNGRFIAQALRWDIPVCSDKPVAATWQQYETLCELTSENPARRVVVSEFPLRVQQAFASARLAVRQGLVGEVVLATAQKSYRFGERPAWYGSREDYGGTILWVASHAIDYVHFVTGLKYTSVTGVQGNVSRTGFGSMEEYTVNTFTLENGSAAVVHADIARPAAAPTHGDDRLRIVGSKGQVEVRDGRCVLMTHEQGPADITSLAPEAMAVAVRMLGSLTGKQPCEAYGTHASLQMAKVLLTARDATDQGRTLAIQMD